MLFYFAQMALIFRASPERVSQSAKCFYRNQDF